MQAWKVDFSWEIKLLESLEIIPAEALIRIDGQILN
jgi:hypothetical protein